MSKHLDQIRSEGYVAGERVAPREHNQHSHGSEEWQCWEDGRLEAEEDFIKSHSVNGQNRLGDPIFHNHQVVEKLANQEELIKQLNKLHEQLDNLPPEIVDRLANGNPPGGKYETGEVIQRLAIEVRYMRLHNKLYGY